MLCVLLEFYPELDRIISLFGCHKFFVEARLSAVKNLKSKNLFGKKGSTIKIHKIDGDGNCLNNALAHQIYYFGIETAEHIKMGIETRQKVIKHINDHFETYFRNQVEWKNQMYGDWMPKFLERIFSWKPLLGWHRVFEGYFRDL